MKRASIILGYLMCALSCAVSSAQSLEKLTACTAVTDERARLKCYDDEMSRLGLKRPAASAKAPTASSAPPAAATAKTPAVSDNFGLEGQALRKKKAADAPSEPEPATLSARVKSVSERPLGELRIELDNGQVWIETEKHAGTTLAVGESITVKPGRMGSYFLTRQSGPTVRVKRLQ